MDTKLADDLMIGAKPIATFLGLPVRQIFYMAEKGQLPLFKVGGTVAGRKSTITAHFAKLEIRIFERDGLGVWQQTPRRMTIGRGPIAEVIAALCECEARL